MSFEEDEAWLGQFDNDPNAAAEQDMTFPVQDPAAVIHQQCDEWIETVYALRFRDLRFPNTQASPFDVDRALTEVRGRADQVEDILSRLLAVKASAVAAAKKAEQAADDAWDGIANRERRTVRRDFEGSKERYAYWNLEIRRLRLTARAAREMADYLRDVHDRIRLHYDGLNETRRDLATRLARLRWETTQER